MSGARPERHATRARLWPVLRALAAVGILIALGVHLGTGAFVAGIRAVGLRSALAALAIGVLTTVCSAWRWCLVARGLGLRLRVPEAVAECYRAVFLNSVLPAGVLGDVRRAVGHGRRAGDVGRGIRAVVLERVSGQVVLAIFAFGVLLCSPTVLRAIFHALPGTWFVVGMLAVLTGGAVLGVGFVAARAGKPRRCLRLLPGVVLLSVAALAGYVVLFVVAARAAGSPGTIGELLPVGVLALLAMGLPVNVGGWGPREAVTSAAFGLVGFGATQGLTVAVVYGALSLISCLPGLGLLLMRGPDGRTPVGAARYRSSTPPPRLAPGQIRAPGAAGGGTAAATRPHADHLTIPPRRGPAAHPALTPVQLDRPTPTVAVGLVAPRADAPADAVRALTEHIRLTATDPGDSGPRR